MSVETISTVVAALAAVGALYYANDTVRLAIKDREDASIRHAEQIDRMEAASVESKRQHKAEIADRQLVQLERISDLLREITDIAREETIWIPSPVVAGSRLYLMCLRLQNAVAALTATGLDNPPETSEIFERAWQGNLDGGAVQEIARQALHEIGQMTLNVGAGTTVADQT